MSRNGKWPSQETCCRDEASLIYWKCSSILIFWSWAKPNIWFSDKSQIRAFLILKLLDYNICIHRVVNEGEWCCKRLDELLICNRDTYWHYHKCQKLKEQEGNALYKPMAYCADSPDVWHVKILHIAIIWSFSQNWHVTWVHLVEHINS